MAKDNIANAEPKKRRGCLIPLLIVVFIFVALIIGIGVGVSGSTKSKQEAKSLLAETMGLTDQQEQDLLAVFDACGILEIKEVTEFQAGENHTSYHVRDVETDSYRGMDGTIVVWLNNDTKAAEEIYFDDHDIYVGGAVVAQVPAFYVSSAQRDEYRLEVQLLVKECLNYPDSAKFGSISKWAFGVNADGYDVVQSSVSAQNAFGVESTEDFQVLFDRATGIPVSLIIDGTEYIQ